MIEDRAAALAAPVPGEVLGRTLCEESAGALADAVIAAGRTGAEVGAPAWDRLSARRTAGDVEGALLGAVDTLAATVGDAPVDALLTMPLTAGETAREELVFTDAAGLAIAARHEHGQWRICVPEATAAAAGAKLVSDARAAALARRPPGPDAAEVAARELVRVVMSARAAWALGVPAAPGFPAALGPVAAVAEAERIRGWCRSWAAGDPVLAPGITELDARWAADPARLPTEGRALLTEVEAACRPVASARVLVENARGLPGTADERARWARLDGEAAARDAALTREGNTVRAVVPVASSGAGPVVVIVPDGAGWVVEAIH